MEGNNNLSNHSWETIYHVLGYVGIGIFICFVVLYIMRFFYIKSNKVNFNDLNNTDKILHTLNSYQHTASTYHNTLIIFFGIFGVISISGMILNWHGAETLDNIKIAEQKYEQSLKNLKDEYSTELSTLKKGFNNEIQIINNRYKNQLKVNRLFTLANTYISSDNEKQIQKALTVCNKIAELDETNPYCYLYSGNAHFKIAMQSLTPKRELTLKARDHFINAITEFNKAIERDKTISILYCRKATALELIGEYISAREAYSKAEELDPNQTPCEVYCVECDL